MASDCRTLPHDIISDVLSRLRVRDLCRLRCVSKSWLALISDPVFQRNHRRIRENNPLLLVTTVDRSKLTHSILDQASRTLDPVTQLTLTDDVPATAASCMDLACSYDLHNVYVCNPATETWIRYSPGNRQFRTLYVALGHVASTSTYKLLRVFSTRGYGGKDHVKFEVLTLGSGRWRAVGGPPGDALLDFYCADKGAAIGGSVYLLWDAPRRGNGVITAFDLDEEAWSFVPFPSDDHVAAAKWSLMEMRGRLSLATRVGRRWLELWFLKRHHEDAPVWEKGCRIELPARADGWTYPLAIEQQSGKILLRTVCYDVTWRLPATYKLICYDPRDKTMEEIYSGQSNFTARYYTESFESLDVKGFKSVPVQNRGTRPNMGETRSKKKPRRVSNKF